MWVGKAWRQVKRRGSASTIYPGKCGVSTLTLDKALIGSTYNRPILKSTQQPSKR